MRDSIYIKPFDLENDFGRFKGGHLFKDENEEKKLEDFNNTPVSELIDESLRVKPREKKEQKQTKKTNSNDNMQSLGF